MWYTATLFYCVLIISLSDSTDGSGNGTDVSIAQSPQCTASNTNLIAFAGIGYDLLEANPDGDFNIGGLDPGYRLAHNFFKLTYTQGKTVNFRGTVVDLPDQMSYTPATACSSIQSARTFSGTSSYQKKLDVNIEASGKSKIY